MKRTILLGFLIISLTINAQDFYSSGDCKASYKFAVNHDIKTLLPATAINFYDTSAGKVKAWYWDCGDSLTSTEQNPMFIFNHPIGGPTVKISPYRTVKLTIVTDSCKSTFSQLINIIDGTLYTQQSCQARYKYSESGRDTVGGTAKIVFNNYSEGTDLKYFWQFGDMETSTEKEPVHKFSLKQPEYKVCLTVTGPDGCTSIDCQPVYLEYPVIIDTVMPGCFVDLGFERQDLLMSPLPSVVMKFYYKSFPEATEWYWDFGDGTTSNEPNPTHIYIKPFTNDSMKVMYNPFRTICLTIKTADECKVNLCQTVQVFDYNPVPEKCPVYFKYYKPNDIVSIPEVVPIRLVDVSEGDVISRLWQFENGKTSTEKEPLVSFDIFQPVHKVCLTVTFADSCVNTFCDAVYVNENYTDTVVIVDSVFVDPACPYYIKIDGGFPIQMSSCAGWASAKVYLGDSLITPKIISWSTGDTLPEVKGLCPTVTYTVKALMDDGCAVWTNFILGSDGSITTVSPINWWLDGTREKFMIKAYAVQGMKVEWRLCDGTIVVADSIPLDAINCGGNEANMIVRDMMGNEVYKETIALKGSFTGIEDMKAEPEIKLWPNPVSSKLNIRYSGEYQAKIDVEIFDVMGKMVSAEIFSNILDGSVFNVNTELLKQGIYICRVSAKGKTLISEKFSRQ